MPENGKVKWFSNVKGFGFLQKDGMEKDIFVHYKDIVNDGYKTLESGEEVTFEIEEGPKGPTAKQVVRIKKPAKEKPQDGAAEKTEAKTEKPSKSAVPAKEAK